MYKSRPGVVYMPSAGSPTSEADMSSKRQGSSVRVQSTSPQHNFLRKLVEHRETVNSTVFELLDLARSLSESA